ncbi:hypothetical protein halTADL_1662 [Halohasta litchfieldiae]|jgi:hypothetical protein|uniref:Uncharacterized protein n=1 Tax=Halohasta litchfieldiae TaxID=1073996 RepID=A0A1H6UTH0_9EURY|nr:DUF5791 family protein [Halohasta litchfieldiae]ATW88417.1 hypothetical protein halTADL_1662 [Halohasta litchfieldiae]SEI94986.1 hypothetical protein SAMN05444271_11329 [Halohasta litchfieldiae]
MLHTVADELSNPSASALQTAYEDRLRSVITTVGTETVVDESEIETDRIAALAEGSSPTLTATEAAAILAVDDETPDAEAIVLELRDHLLLGMTTSVLDVDTIAANIDVDLTAQEVQQAIEGRTEMTLSQLAAIQSVIDGWER